MYQEVLTIEQIAQYQDAFRQFSNSDGSCTSSQVGPIMRTFGQNPSEAAIQDMVNAVDKDGSGMIDFPEFLMMMALKADYENAEDQIREAFQVFDGVIRLHLNSYYNNCNLHSVLIGW